MMAEGLNQEQISKAKTAVFRFLKIRLRSEQEIAEKLKIKKFDKNIIKETIRYFKDIELINDRVFAKAWIRSRLNKPFGFGRIKNELKTKGVAEDILQEEFENIKSDDYQESEIVLKAAQRRASVYKNVDPLKLKQRLLGYLTRRGFSSESIYKALKKIK